MERLEMEAPRMIKKDTERENVVRRVWTRFVLICETLGEPVCGGNGSLVEVPEHVTDYGRWENEMEAKKAREATMAIVVKLPNEEH